MMNVRRDQRMEKNRVQHVIFRYSDNISAAILSLWCVLPIAIVGIFFVMGAQGKFTDVETAVSMGFTPGAYNNLNAIAAYYRAFRDLGIITIIYGAFLLAFNRRSIWKQSTVIRQPWFFLLLGVLLWAVISTVVSDDPLHGFTGDSYYHDSLFSYFVYAALFLCASSIGQERQRLRILRLFGAVVCGLSVLMLIQVFFDSAFLDYCFPSQRATVFNQFNHFGYVLCMGSITLAGLYLHDLHAVKGLKMAYLVGFTLLIFTLLVNDTFGTYLAVLAALVFDYIVLVRSNVKVRFEHLIPILLFLGLSFLAAMGVFPGVSTFLENFRQFFTDLSIVAENPLEADSAGTGRFILWKNTIERIIQRPIFGFGPDGFVGEYAITANVHSHNEYLQIAGYLGIPALLMYLAALFALARDHGKRIRQLSPMVLAVSGSTVAYLISACFGNPVFNTAPYFWMFLGMTTADGVNPPLLSIEPDAMEKQLSAKPSRRRVGILIGIGAVMLAGIVGGSLYLSHQTEKTNEAADLQCMRIAENVSRMWLRSGQVNTGETYWFDANNYALIPDDEPAPTPYGLGTSHIGGALKPFIREYDLQYSYDEAVDHREMVIKVNIYEGADGEPQIEMIWVSVS